MPQLKPQRGNALLCTHNKEAKEMEATLRKEIAAKEQEAVEASTKLTDLQTSVREAFACSICKSIPTNCQATRCGHAFCRECIYRLCEGSYSQRTRLFWALKGGMEDRGDLDPAHPAARRPVGCVRSAPAIPLSAHKKKIFLAWKRCEFSQCLKTPQCSKLHGNSLKKFS